MRCRLEGLLLEYDVIFVTVVGSVLRVFPRAYVTHPCCLVVKRGLRGITIGHDVRIRLATVIELWEVEPLPR